MDTAAHADNEPEPELPDPDAIASTDDFAAALKWILDHVETRDGRKVKIPRLAERIGLGKSSLYDFQDGKRLISSENLHRLLGELNVPPEYVRRLRRVRDRVAAPIALALPMTLPVDVESFTGRTVQLDELDRLCRKRRKKNTVVITAVSGVGGIGKTTLAVHWVHQNYKRFPDGCIHLDLRGFRSDTPLPPEEALAALLRRLDVPGPSIPTNPDERALRYQRRLVGKRMLILLDNAFSTEQVRPLLPPGNSDCFVLITSRDKLTGLIVTHRAGHLPVDVLAELDARALLINHLDKARLDAEPDAAADVLAFCAGLPLALTIVAARIHTNPYTPLATIAAELRNTGLDALDNPDPNASLKAVLSWSHTKLTTEQARLFELLSLAPGPDIGTPAAASLANLPINTAKKLLHELEQVSLLQRHAPDRYRMHDLVDLYAADQTHHNHLDDDIRTAALRRILDFYTHTAQAGDQLLHPHRQADHLKSPDPGIHRQPLSDDPTAVAWFDTEHANLLVAQHTAAVHAQHHTVWHLAWALTTFHYRRGHLQDDVVAWRAALDAATHLPNPTTRIITLRYLGRACAALGRHEDAIEYLHQAIDLSNNHHSPTERAHVHRTLAWAWGQRGSDRLALDHAKRALHIFRALDQSVWEARTLNTVGWYAARLGEYDTARDHCEAALILYHRHQDLDGKANTLDSLGYIDHHTGRYHQAIDYYQQSLTLFHELGDTYHSADTLGALGHPHAALGQHEWARTAWQEALELYRKQNRDDDAAQVQQQLDDLTD